MKPLTKDKILYTAPILTEGNNHERNFVSKELFDSCKTSSDEPLLRVRDVKQALELLKKKIRELPNRDDWLQKDLPIASAVLDGGGVGRVEILELIDKCFPAFKEKNE